MGWFILAQLFSILIALVRLGRWSEREKDLEIQRLRQQVSILLRNRDQPVRATQVEKLTLAVFTARLKEITHRSAKELGEIMRRFQPETGLGGQRELVRRTWTFTHPGRGGRPRLSQEVEDRIVPMAQENPLWGYGKIQGELLKLGDTVCESAVRDSLKRHPIQPALTRNGSESWRHLMAHDKEQILACDFFSVDRLWLKRLYVLFFIELGTRHLRRVLNTYGDYDNQARPHPGIGQPSPIPRTLHNTTGIIQNRKVLGGIINDDYRSPGSTLMHFNGWICI